MWVWVEEQIAGESGENGTKGNAAANNTKRESEMMGSGEDVCLERSKTDDRINLMHALREKRAYGKLPANYSPGWFQFTG